MRTRRRPVLQDKTPINTPQKPRAKAKSKPIPVVEIKARTRRNIRGKHGEPEQSMTVDGGEASGTQLAVPEEEPSPIHQPTRAKRGKDKEENVIAEPVVERELEVVPNVKNRIAPVKNIRKLPSSHSPTARPTVQRTLRASVPSTRNKTIVRHSVREKREMVRLETPLMAELRVPASAPSPKGEMKNVRQSVRGKREKVTLETTTVALRVPGSLPPSSFPLSSRPNTPDSVPIADDDSTASDAARAILNTPSPARIFRAPIPAQSTPLGRLPPLEQSLLPRSARGRHESSIRRWNATVAAVAREHSPLPPSSPPPASPPTQVPVATSSQQQLRRYQFSDEPDEDQENNAILTGRYVRKDTPSDDDPFGLLAAERKLKTLRQRKLGMESSRVPGATRAPLGTLALDEIPSSVAIPDRLPTPLPSDDDHNIDDFYLDVDPVRPGHSHADDAVPDDEEGEDKENIPTDDYDLNENKENLRPPHLVVDDEKESEVPAQESQELDEHNISAPLLVVSAKKGLDELLDEPSSSSASPTHALRTPHKHRSAHQRSPLPTPHFSDGGLSDSPLTALSMRNSSPSPIKPSVVRRSQTRAGPSKPRRPLATLELAEPEPEPRPKTKSMGRKRTREQVEESEDSDPRAAVRKLEALLPKRKVRATSSTRGMAVKSRRTVKGKGRENLPVSENEEESEHEDSSPPKAKAKVSRGRGRGTARARGRGRGIAAALTKAAPATRGRSTSRGRPVSKGKGKEKAVEHVDLDEDEELVRKRQERIEYFRKLQEYSLEKEDVYVI